MHAEAQKEITVYYENEIVGEFIADIIVENLVILELKSVRRVVKAHVGELPRCNRKRRWIDIKFRRKGCRSETKSSRIG